ncbi:MAG: hypothetical protein R3C59_14930 [Planctomycetaceae bacterium]
MPDHREKITFPCPFCGEDVMAGAKVCRACGASDDCGWQESDEFDTATDDFDYEEFVSREFPDSDGEHRAASPPTWVRLVILAIIVSFLLSLGLF